MGMSHILWIYEDGLRTYNREKTQEAVGASVMSACLESKRKLPVLGAVNCINRVGSVHSTDEQILFWSKNCLRTLNELTDEEVEEAKRLFDELYYERKQI